MKASALLLVFLLMGARSVLADPPALPPPASDKLGPQFRTACWKGNLPEVLHLLEAGAPLENRDVYGRTPLFLACHGDTEVVRLLLSHGARADVTDFDGDTTVGRACEYGDLDSAKMVLTAGADLGRVNREGRTPLMMASREGHTDVVAWLLAQHVDVNYSATNVPALFYAAGHDRCDIARMLLDAGARTDISPVPFTGAKYSPTLMSSAALTNDPLMIELMLQHGALINQRDSLGFTALLSACKAAKPETIVILLDHGADLNLADNGGYTPLMAASDNQGFATIRVLVERGARLEDRDASGRTVLIRAAAFDESKEARELVTLKADVNATDPQGETALTYAGDRGDMRLVLFLKASGARRTDLHIIPKPGAQPPLSPAQRWALAVGALYTRVNGDNDGRLDGPDIPREPGDLNKGMITRRRLSEQWKITDRATLLITIARLEQPPTLVGTLVAQTLDSLSRSMDEDRLARAFQLLFFDSWWLGKTNVAWNLCRAANLVRNGVMAGYLTEKDAWPLLMEIARTTQSRFSSWHEMSDNFIDGRSIGANEPSGDFRASAQLLLDPAERNSPWNQLAWNTDLGAAGVGAPAAGAH